ncbi:MAG: hypothetical protein K2G25_09330, partial [Oscillospiraceae bacterium]|nr:hypothetical protein [Oscillospiraceae bacterium]
MKKISEIKIHSKFNSGINSKIIQKTPSRVRKLLKPDVITEMRIRFVATAMAILIMIFIIMLGSINMIMKTVSQSQSMGLLEEIANSDRYDTLNAESEPILKPSQKPELDFRPGSDSELNNDISNIKPLAWLPDHQQQQRPDGSHDPGNRPEQNFPDDENNFDEFHKLPFVPDDREESPSESMPEYPPESISPDWEDSTFPEEFIPPPEQSASERIPEEPAVFAESELSEENPEFQELPEIPEFSESIEETESVKASGTMSAESTEVTETTGITDTIDITESDPVTTAAEADLPELPEEPFPERNPWTEPRPDKWKVNIMLDHFALMADPDGNFLDLRNTEDYTREQAAEILDTILDIDRQQGMYNWLQYYKTEKSYGTLVVITDKSSDQGLLNNLFRTTAVIGVLMLLILFVFLVFFSRKITAPVQAALDRQKQFVSDAGHELKTPLAVLTANADILKDEIGENKWLGYMQEQTDRMSQLVGGLLRLARMDNATQEYSFAEFNLSHAVEATALPFESQAFELEKNLELDIQPDVSYYGSEQHIRQLAAIFIDNAMKYSNEHGTIKITLLQRGDDRILEFYNTGCEISQEETHKIFERFYRGDKARNNKGKNGYGLGLAIARSIMDIHHIRIQVT